MNAVEKDLTRETKIDLLKTMFLSRYGDFREERLIRQGKGWFHVSSMGHEALATVALCLEEGDYAFPFYRDRAFVLGRGVTNYELALAFYAKKGSSSGGRQLPGHYCNRRLNIWSVASPIALHMLPAAGVAWGLTMDGKENVVVTMVGEGGTRQGDFYESVCFAKERRLPMVFIVEDNGVAISTRTEDMHALAIDAIPQNDWLDIDGSNPSQVYSIMQETVQRVRSGEGPAFLWCRTERLSSHSSADDHRNYRSKEELESIELRDPIKRFKKELLAEGVLTEKVLKDLEDEIQESVKEDYQKAEKAAEPKAGEEMKQIFGPLKVGKAPPLKGRQEYRMADALNQTFKKALQTNKDCCFFGEDIEDPLGGVFKLTKGLSTEFPDKVFNSPLAESSILGIAAGLASYGKRPVFEIQFIDFISPGWNQLVSNISTLRWRSNGEWTCPAIIYAPCGAYLPGGGIWHSQSNESVFAHYPGLLVVMPSTPEDASGLLMSALACEDPVLFLIPKHLLWVPKEVPRKLEPIPLGKAAMRQEGSDLTLVTWGNGTELVEEALKDVNPDASIEFIDLRSIVPWDKEAVMASIAKTGRLVVVQEDTYNCSMGQMIIAHFMEEHAVWNALIAPPVLVSKGNVNIGFNPTYEYSSLPDAEQVLNAINKALAFSKPRKSHSAASFSNITALSQEPEKLQEHLAASASQRSVKTVILPNLGEGLREARVVEIFKKAGDSVAQDEPLCEVETDKAVFPIESSVDGVVKEWRIKEEDLIAVGTEIVDISLSESGSADVEGVLVGSSADVEHITDAKGALSNQVIQQLEGVLPASLSVKAEWKTLREVRARLRGRSSGGAFSYTTMVAWCVVRAMENTPAFCRLLRNGKISEPQKDFDIGFAVALENDELETAVITKANTLSWGDFVAVYRKGLKKTRDGVPQSKARTSLLLTSMGPMNIRSASPIVVPPATATLFLGEPHWEVYSENKETAFREVVSLNFCFDHRWANGAGAGYFLKQIKGKIEHFDREDLD